MCPITDRPWLVWKSLSETPALSRLLINYNVRSRLEKINRRILDRFFNTNTWPRNHVWNCTRSVFLLMTLNREEKQWRNQDFLKRKRAKKFCFFFFVHNLKIDAQIKVIRISTNKISFFFLLFNRLGIVLVFLNDVHFIKLKIWVTSYFYLTVLLPSTKHCNYTVIYVGIATFDQNRFLTHFFVLLKRNITFKQI